MVVHNLIEVLHGRKVSIETKFELHLIDSLSTKAFYGNLT